MKSPSRRGRMCYHQPILKRGTRVGPRARNLYLLERAWILALAGAVSGASPCGLAAQPARPELQAGPALERRLAGGEAHSYALQARPGERLLIAVDQQGIDVEVVALRADGTTLIAVDSPTDSQGLESLLLPADAAGPLEIRIGSPSPGVAPGAYTVKVETLAESTAAGRERVEAERLMTGASAGTREGKAESLRRAAGQYAEAQAHWRSLGDRPEEARCALAAGGVAMNL